MKGLVAKGLLAKVMTFCAAFGLMAYFTHSVFADECHPDTQTSFHSPDKSFDVVLKAFAVLRETDCTAFPNLFSVSIRDTRVAENDTEVFATNAQPDVAWRDKTHLFITIKRPLSWIPISLHQAGAVTVIYRLNEGLEAAKSDKNAQLKTCERFMDWAKANTENGNSTDQ